MKKKAQMQIQETILVVFIFIIIMIFGLILFFRFTEQSIIQGHFENEKLRFESMITTFPLTPEIRCSFLSQEASCIDSYKLLAFKTLNKEEYYKNYYRSNLGYINITIYSLYPEKNGKICESATISDCGVWDLYVNKPKKINNKFVVRSPVSLYYPDKDGFGIGEIVIEWYS